MLIFFIYVYKFKKNALINWKWNFWNRVIVDFFLLGNSLEMYKHIFSFTFFQSQLIFLAFFCISVRAALGNKINTFREIHNIFALYYFAWSSKENACLLFFLFLRKCILACINSIKFCNKFVKNNCILCFYKHIDRSLKAVIII